MGECPVGDCPMGSSPTALAAHYLLSSIYAACLFALYTRLTVAVCIGRVSDAHETSDAFFGTGGVYVPPAPLSRPVSPGRVERRGYQVQQE